MNARQLWRGNSARYFTEEICAYCSLRVTGRFPQRDRLSLACAFAKLSWPASNLIGKMIVTPDDRQMTVVGVNVNLADWESGRGGTLCTNLAVQPYIMLLASLIKYWEANTAAESQLESFPANLAPGDTEWAFLLHCLRSSLRIQHESRPRLETCALMSTSCSMSPLEMAQQTGSGLLSFPVTHFNETYDFLEEEYRAHLAFLLENGPAALFPAGGTGEFFSLTLQEYARVVSAAVSETAGRVPVIAGCGYGTRTAIQFAQAAEQAGADGLLLLPPYLVTADPTGLIAHTREVCASTRLGVIFYNRDNAVLDEAALEALCDSCPNLVGLKDGHGDLELITRIRARIGDRLFYIGGLPTAETFALPYMDIGVTTYSSAIFNFLPKFASDFYAAVKDRDQNSLLSKLREFVLPYIGIRNRRKGYAVSIVKAGMEIVGRSAGPVRPPLVDLRANEKEELAALVSSIR